MRNKKIIAGIVLMIAIVCLLIMSFILFWRKQQQSDYITFGKDQIPTISFVLGDRSLVGISTEISHDVEAKTYEYKSESIMEDIDRYMNYLRDEEGFVALQIGDSDDDVIFAKESVDSGKIIVVQPYTSKEGYKIIFGKGGGEIAPD